MASILVWGVENGLDLAEFPHLDRWWRETAQRPAFAQVDPGIAPTVLKPAGKL